LPTSRNQTKIDDKKGIKRSDFFATENKMLETLRCTDLQKKKEGGKMIKQTRQCESGALFENIPLMQGNDGRGNKKSEEKGIYQFREACPKRPG